MDKVFELKVFKNGGSNAIRIPATIEIPDGRLYLVVGDDDSMRLERRNPQPMKGFFDLLDQMQVDGRLATIADEEFVREDWSELDREWMDELEAAFADKEGRK
ncbi:MAG: hypothetical protein KGL77_03420 [Actinomycetales bacterium]|nr:hypothetical protein [Actinomycetales bacterium]